MKTLVALIFACVLFSLSVFAQNPGWNVTLQRNTTARSNVEVINQCQGTHNFKLEFHNVPFLQPQATTQTQVGGGQSRQIPVIFNTNGLLPGNYQGEVLVICESCKSEPTCRQDRERLPVNLTIANPNPTPTPWPANPQNQTNPTTPTALPTPGKRDQESDVLGAGAGPCDILKSDCEKLRQITWESEASAAAARDIADKLKERADQAEKNAKGAEDSAAKAEKAAQPSSKDGTITADGETFSQADSDYLEAKKQKLLDDWKAGKISAEEQQRQRAALSGTDALKKAREERLANEAKLKKEADEARKKADAERRRADEARSAADEAKRAADDEKKAADEARKKYEECLKKAEEECLRIEKEKRDREEAAKKSAAAAAQQREEDEIRKKQEETNKAAQAAQQKYLLDNIRQLGLISHKGFSETPGIWDWVPAILERPVGDFFEEVGKTPIPTDVIKAIGGLFNVLANLLDPCSQAGKRKTVERLMGMVNPKTNSKYTLDQALDKTEKMCDLLRELKAKVEKIKAAQAK